MGNWVITIHGTGAHNNYDPPVEYDANKLAAEFVKQLKAKGHNVSSARFTAGAEDIIESVAIGAGNIRVGQTAEAYLEQLQTFEALQHAERDRAVATAKVVEI